MKGLCGALVAMAVLLPNAKAQKTPTADLPTAASAKTYKFVNSGWAEQENILARAIGLRARKIEEKTGFQFDMNWTPKVSLEWSLGRGVNDSNGIYKAETQTISFPIRIVYEFETRHNQLSDSVTAETAAADADVGEVFDHELGHALMDQVSRRNGLGPWFTSERFDASTDEQRLGLDILSEGIALFFQRVYFPRDDSDLSELTFPATREQQQFFTYRMIAYDGGYWIVRDVLSRYGERGLIWLMRHPPVVTDNMRAAAVTYRHRALKELSQK